MLVKGIESCMLWHSTYTLPAQLIDCIRAMSEVQRTQHTQRTHYTPHSDRTQRHTAQHDIGHSTQHNTQHTHHIVLFGSVRKWRDPPRTGQVYDIARKAYPRTAAPAWFLFCSALPVSLLQGPRRLAHLRLQRCFLTMTDAKRVQTSVIPRATCLVL